MKLAFLILNAFSFYSLIPAASSTDTTYTTYECGNYYSEKRNTRGELLPKHRQSIRWSNRHNEIPDASWNQEELDCALIDAVHPGETERVALLLELGASPHLIFGNKKLLHFACSRGHTDVVNLLLDAGADLYATCWCPKTTALESASMADHSGTVQALINRIPEAERKAFIDFSVIGADCALHRAAQFGTLATLELLMAYGANVHTTASCHKCPILVSAISSDKDRLAKVKALVAAGALVNATSEYGETPLMRATTKNDFTVVRFLLKNGAAETINNKNYQGNTALMKAIASYNAPDPATTALLLKCGADRTLANEKGETALDMAKEQEQHEKNFVADCGPEFWREDTSKKWIPIINLLTGSDDFSTDDEIENDEDQGVRLLL